MQLHTLFNLCMYRRNVKGIFLEIAPWTGRFYSLLDPSYAKNNIPIIASVSEHQPTAWSSFYFDLQILVFTFPGMWFLIIVPHSRELLLSSTSLLTNKCCYFIMMVFDIWKIFRRKNTSCIFTITSVFSVGLYVCFKDLNDHNIFIILYALTSIYFAVSVCFSNNIKKFIL